MTEKRIADCGVRIADCGVRIAEWGVRIEGVTTEKGEMDAESRELERRTKAFALRILKFVGGCPKTLVSGSMGCQLVRCGPSVGADYREANRAESRDDFIHKIGVVEKEASETCYWLELCEEAGIGDAMDRQWLLKESSELLAIFTSNGKTVKSRYRKPRS